MGLIRKSMSVYSLGLIDFQSDRERMARSARLTKQAVRKQNRMIAAQSRAPRPATPSGTTIKPWPLIIGLAVFILLLILFYS